MCLGEHTYMCVPGSTLTCVSRGAHLHVCPGEHTYMCVPGSTLTCVSRGSTLVCSTRTVYSGYSVKVYITDRGSVDIIS